MDEKQLRKEALAILSNRAEQEGWTMQDCLSFIFDRLYDEYSQMTTKELLTLVETAKLPKCDIYQDVDFNHTSFFFGGKI